MPLIRRRSLLLAASFAVQSVNPPSPISSSVPRTCALTLKQRSR